MQAQLVNLLLLLALWAVAAWTVVVGVPMVARARLVHAVGEIRDEVVDAQLGDQLPRVDPAVWEFVKVTELVAVHPARVGLTEALAVHLAYHDVGAVLPEPPSYAELEPEQRCFMHNRERRLQRAIRDYMVFGSRFWPVLASGLVVRRLLLSLRLPKLPTPMRMPTSALAEEARTAAGQDDLRLSRTTRPTLV